MYELLDLMSILQHGCIPAREAWHIQGVGEDAAPSADKKECIETAEGVEAVVVDSEVEDTGKLAAGKGGVLIEL